MQIPSFYEKKTRLDMLTHTNATHFNLIRGKRDIASFRSGSVKKSDTQLWKILVYLMSKTQTNQLTGLKSPLTAFAHFPQI